MKCATCSADLEIQVHGLFGGELVSADGAPHRLDCPGERTRPRQDGQPCPSCGQRTARVTRDRKGSFTRCLDADCRHWSYQSVLLPGGLPQVALAVDPLAIGDAP